MFGCSMSPFVREHRYAVYDMLMYFWNSSPTDCLAVSITYNGSKQWSTGERIVYLTVCFISWVPEIFSRVRRGASSADTPSAIGRRHERRRVPRAPRISGSQSICFTPPRGSKKVRITLSIGYAVLTFCLPRATFCSS